jgi:hypothetical protein
MCYPAAFTTVPYEPPPVLGEYSTEFAYEGKDEARAKNIELAVSKLQDWDRDNYWDPQGEFSFNDAVGPRTLEAGFLNAPVLFLGEVAEGVGGGVCQVSSTMHAAALMSGLEIVSRRPHTRFSKYIVRGLDATVAYPPECKGNHRENAANRKNKDCYSVDLVLKDPYGSGLGIRTSIEEAGPGKKRLKIQIVSSMLELKNAEYKASFTGGDDFHKKFHKTGRIRTASYKRLVQSGQQGAHVSSVVRYFMKDGSEKEFKYKSDYPPVDEVWEVGLQWDASGPPPWGSQTGP